MKERMNERQFAEFVKNLPHASLERALVDIYTRLNCDDGGHYVPENSVAAHSAADFIDSYDHTLRELGCT